MCDVILDFDKVASRQEGVAHITWRKETVAEGVEAYFAQGCVPKHHPKGILSFSLWKLRVQDRDGISAGAVYERVPGRKYFLPALPSFSWGQAYTANIFFSLFISYKIVTRFTCSVRTVILVQLSRIYPYAYPRMSLEHCPWIHGYSRWIIRASMDIPVDIHGKSRISMRRYGHGQLDPGYF